MNGQTTAPRPRLATAQVMALLAALLLGNGACQNPMPLALNGTPTPKARPDIIVFALDLSHSTADEAAHAEPLGVRRCGEVETALRARVAQKPSRALRVQVLQTGVGDTAVRTALAWTELGGRVGAPKLELPQAARARVSAQIQAFAARCRNAVVPSDSSPLFALAETALRSADAECREGCGHAEVRLHTDGAESGPLAQPWLQTALASASRNSKPSDSATPNPLTTKAEVVICGFAEAKAPKTRRAKGTKHSGVASLAEREAVWAKVIQAAALRFEPTCARGEEGPAEVAVGRGGAGGGM